jgi:hypothetical protein
VFGVVDVLDVRDVLRLGVEVCVYIGREKAARRALLSAYGLGLMHLTMTCTRRTAGAPPSSCLSPGLTPLERYVALGLASCPIDNAAKISLFQILGEPLPQIEKHRVLRPRRLTLVPMADADQSNRPHRKTKEKKAAHSGAPNPKAFAFATPGRLQKQAARSHDVCYPQPFD